MNNLFLSDSELDQYFQEKYAAQQAREHGLEGRARVSARRAAGLLAKRILVESSPGYSDSTLFSSIMNLMNSDQIHPMVCEIFRHFTIQVDSDLHLPDQIDLLADLDQLESFLGIKNITRG